jgi:hypothetical protein
MSEDLSLSLSDEASPVGKRLKTDSNNNNNNYSGSGSGSGKGTFIDLVEEDDEGEERQQVDAREDNHGWEAQYDEDPAAEHGHGVWEDDADVGPHHDAPRVRIRSVYGRVVLSVACLSNEARVKPATQRPLSPDDAESKPANVSKFFVPLSKQIQVLVLCTYFCLSEETSFSGGWRTNLREADEDDKPRLCRWQVGYILLSHAMQTDRHAERQIETGRRTYMHSYIHTDVQPGRENRQMMQHCDCLSKRVNMCETFLPSFI